MLAIRHETIYRYTAPLAYTIQQLRLTPRHDTHQQIKSWNIATGGRCHAFVDAFGNTCHTLTISDRHDEVRIVAAGAVDIAPLYRGRLPGRDVLSPLVFTVPSRLTEPTAAIRSFAAQHLAAGARSHAMLALAEAIRGTVAYQSGATVVTTTATDALQLQQGVCQDHAHLFLACCHTQDIPARYVSGYIHAGDTDHAESHAWVDVWVDDIDFSGWISIDVTHAQFTSAMHCRLAVGRDYDSAAPVRGVRRGGGTETMTVQVDVSST
ncbi:transglutaminase family protein [Noviherbaspirillum sedimenti]|uniref:Transglutaminase family protein n=1 Tax=Noviherbaspirillum sedimenti TaxID=2320865 RepID=A0A3A3G786_9BURK|nr:transglutaminase family protein [Noviherbaspirillum sedimenti]RJG03821.1 transglutaminase family protein [Noviherbaspirillum sedimenti]